LSKRKPDSTAAALWSRAASAPGAMPDQFLRRTSN